jgi:hypothetical protein
MPASFVRVGADGAIVTNSPPPRERERQEDLVGQVLVDRRADAAVSWSSSAR